MNKKDFEIVLTLAKIGLTNQIAKSPRKRDNEIPVRYWNDGSVYQSIDNAAQFVIDHNGFEIEETE